ncbi:MAG TPA: response regulator transcription factor [Candidatus Choladousia intestinigallinarum]|nr:response regulator transcription factor [Candidatus Choladousia intestinigallinarum]
MKEILILEDDKKLNDGIRLALKNEYLCRQAFSIEEGRERLKEGMPDLILLDVNLPDGSGMEFLEEIRRQSQIPVLMLTANKMEMDIVSGLESGANDYITKPFSLMVLRARIRVWLREEPKKEGVFRQGDFTFDFNRMEFSRGKEMLELSRTEQKLLRCLLEGRGRTVSRELLIDRVWSGETEYVDEHALTVAVNRLRKKLEGKGSPERIRTVYGIGYMWLQD